MKPEELKHRKWHEWFFIRLIGSHISAGPGPYWYGYECIWCGATWRLHANEGCGWDRENMAPGWFKKEWEGE